MAHRITTCTFCGVGCGLYLETSGNTVIGVSPSISHLSAKALKRAYEAMPAPKLVFAIGQCDCGGGLWYDTYTVMGPVEKILPVNYYIPGCPPRPEAIIYGVAVALGLVDKKTTPILLKQAEYPIPQYHPGDLRMQDELVVYEKVEKI